MKKTFLLKVQNKKDLELYSNHSTYHKGDAGLDLFCPQDITVLPGETILLDLRVSCQSKSLNTNIFELLSGKLWKYHSYLLMPRSSISKTPFIMQNSIGLIDMGYTGTLKVPLLNTTIDKYVIKRGQRLVQLVNSDLSPVSFKLVNNHRETSRNTEGFGSTGQ